MQSIDHSMDAVALFTSGRLKIPGELSQIPLDYFFARHRNFSKLGGKATGTYRFIIGFYGLTDMPATFQKLIDKTLEGIHSQFAFLDNILITTKGILKKT